MKIEFGRPIPQARAPHPARKILEELKTAPVGASVLVPTEHARAAVLFVSGDWCRWQNEAEGTRFFKFAEPVTRDATSAADEVREEDIQLPEVVVDETSAEPEASVTPQAEEVKPEEDDIHLRDEIVDEDMGFLDEAEPLSIEELVRSGTMLTEDERAMRIGILSGRIEEYAQERIGARYDANARADLQRDLETYIHKGALHLEITATEDAAYARANEKLAWIRATESHARQLREGLPKLGLEMLRAYRLEEAGWP